MNIIKFDPLINKNPSGTIRSGESIEFKIKIENSDNIPSSVYLMIREDSEKDYKYIKMKREDEFFVASEVFINKGHYFYNFKLIFSYGEFYLNRTFDYYSSFSNAKGDDFVQIVTSENYECNNSLQGGLIYQIMIDRFCKLGEVKSREPLLLRNDFGGDIKKYSSDPVKLNEQVFGGNIKGVISKLNYLKDLGVTAIYFTPICKANSHHKYDTADYFKIDEMLGTESEFKELVKKAKSKGIKIIIDGVYNHTGSDSVYFNKNKRFGDGGAYNDKNSPYYEWFSFKKYPNDYESWWGITTLPSIKKDCKSYQDFIAGENGVIDYFMKMGVFGVRVDVVDELSDEFVKKISDKISSYGKDKVCMGEVWEDASTKISYGKRREYFTNNEINSVMNYPLKDGILSYIKTKNSMQLNAVIRMLLCSYPKLVLDNLLNSLGTHDTSRLFSEIKNFAGLGDYDYNHKTHMIRKIIKKNDNKKTFEDIIDKTLLSDLEPRFDYVIKMIKIAYVLLFTISGVPSIFYGDEYAMENSDDNPRACFDWDNYQNEIYHFIKSLSIIRKKEVLKDGEMNILLSKEGKFVFERFNKNEQIIVMTNLGSSNLTIDLGGDFVSFFNGQIKSSVILKENEFDILINNINLYK